MRITREQFEAARKASLCKWDGAIFADNWRKWCRTDGYDLCGLCYLSKTANIPLNVWCGTYCVLQDGIVGKSCLSACCYQFICTIGWAYKPYDDEANDMDNHISFLRAVHTLQCDIRGLKYEDIQSEFREEENNA